MSVTESSLDFPISDFDWDTRRRNDSLVHLGKVSSVHEVLQPIIVELTRFLKINDIQHYLLLKKFLTQRQHDELMGIHNKNDQAIRFFLMLQNMPQPQDVVKHLYLILMDSYEKDGVVEHYYLARRIAERVRGTVEEDCWKEISDAVDRLPLKLLEPECAAQLLRNLGEEDTQSHMPELREILCCWQSKSCGAPIDKVLGRIVRALLLTEGLGHLVSNLLPTCMCNPPVVQRIMASLGEKWKILACYLGYTRQQVAIMEEKNHRDQNTCAFLRVFRMPDCGEQTENMLEALLRHTDIEREIGRVAECQEMHPRQMHLVTHIDQRRYVFYNNCVLSNQKYPLSSSNGGQQQYGPPALQNMNTQHANAALYPQMATTTPGDTCRLVPPVYFTQTSQQESTISTSNHEGTRQDQAVQNVQEPRNNEECYTESSKEIQEPRGNDKGYTQFAPEVQEPPDNEKGYMKPPNGKDEEKILDLVSQDFTRRKIIKEKILDLGSQDFTRREIEEKILDLEEIFYDYKNIARGEKISYFEKLFEEFGVDNEIGAVGAIRDQITSLGHQLQQQQQQHEQRILAQLQHLQERLDEHECRQHAQAEGYAHPQHLCAVPSQVRIVRACHQPVLEVPTGGPQMRRSQSDGEIDPNNDQDGNDWRVTRLHRRNRGKCYTLRVYSLRKEMRGMEKICAAVSISDNKKCDEEVQALLEREHLLCSDAACEMTFGEEGIAEFNVGHTDGFEVKSTPPLSEISLGDIEASPNKHHYILYTLRVDANNWNGTLRFKVTVSGINEHHGPFRIKVIRDDCGLLRVINPNQVANQHETNRNPTSPPNYILYFIVLFGFCVLCYMLFLVTIITMCFILAFKQNLS